MSLIPSMDDIMWPENRSSYYSPENRSSYYSPENRSSYYSPECRSSYYSPENRSSYYSPEGRSSYYSPENRSSYYSQMTPWQRQRGYFSNVLNEGFREIQKLERNLGEMNMNEDPYSYRCSVAGYFPEELKVNVEGNELVIKGEHKNSGDGQSVQRWFTRRFTLPQNINKDRIQCNINEKVQMEVVFQKAGETGTQNIPIGFKPTNGQEQFMERKQKF